MEKKIVPIFYACDDAFVKYTVVSLYSMIKNASSDCEYKVHILHTNISDDMKEKLLALGNENFEISFENVSFGYNDAEYVLKNINLKINKGEMVGFVGRSGVGKTTAANLILRLYDPLKIPPYHLYENGSQLLFHGCRYFLFQHCF